MYTYIHTIRKFARVHSQWQCIPGKGEWSRMILGSLGDGYGNGSREMGMNAVLMSLHTTYTVKSHSESIHSCILPCMLRLGIAELQWEIQPNWFTPNVHMSSSHSKRHKNGPY